MRLVHQGGRIVYLSDAVVSEAVVPNRLTIRWRLKRQYRSSANRVYIESKLFGAKKPHAVPSRNSCGMGWKGRCASSFPQSCCLGAIGNSSAAGTTA